MSARDPITDAVQQVLYDRGYTGDIRQDAQAVLDAALPLVAAHLRAEWLAVKQGERPRPLDSAAEVSTDFANDFEWCAQLVEGLS